MMEKRINIVRITGAKIRLFGEISKDLHIYLYLLKEYLII